jgi:serine/threonine protein kinase
MAPETLNYLGPAESEITNAVDIWAAGCIIYRLIAGAVPFPPGMTLMKYCEDRSKFPQHALFESEAKIDGSAFIRGLLAANPHERPTARDALRHEWLVSGNKFRPCL